MLLILSVVIGVAFDLSWGIPIKYYASRYDHIDVEAILNNRRLVKAYAQCLLSRGPCPPEGIEFKRILPEALQTNCARCSEKQKTVTLRVIKRLRKEYPKIWAELSEQWDPDDIFIKKFESTSKKKISPTQILTASTAASEASQIFTTSTATPESPLVFNRFADIENNLPESPEMSLPYSSLSTSVLSSSTSTPLTLSTPVLQEPEPEPSISTSVTETLPYPSPSSTTPSTTRSSSTSSITPPNTTRSSSSTSKTNSGQTYTNKSFIISMSTTNVPTIRQNIGANIEATVSVGTNIVDDFVRSLGAIGSRVVETGVEIAEVVFRSLSKPL